MARGAQVGGAERTHLPKVGKKQTLHCFPPAFTAFTGDHVRLCLIFHVNRMIGADLPEMGEDQKTCSKMLTPEDMGV